MPPRLDAVVVGNVTLDVLCYPVDDVPRHESMAFERAAVGPGGCASNTAVVLAAQGVATAVVAYLGDDHAGQIARATWRAYGVADQWVSTVPQPTAVSVGLVDSAYQPRFIHTSGANAGLTPAAIQPETYAAWGARWLHVAGYFVLPGLLTPRLAERLQQARRLGLRTSLDVVTSPAMDDPAALWPCATAGGRLLLQPARRPAPHGRKRAPRHGGCVARPGCGCGGGQTGGRGVPARRRPGHGPLPRGGSGARGRHHRRGRCLCRGHHCGRAARRDLATGRAKGQPRRRSGRDRVGRDRGFSPSLPGLTLDTPPRAGRRPVRNGSFFQGITGVTVQPWQEETTDYAERDSQMSTDWAKNTKKSTLALVSWRLTALWRLWQPKKSVHIRDAPCYPWSISLWLNSYVFSLRNLRNLQKPNPYKEVCQ